MVGVRFVMSDGREESLDLPEGLSLMESAVRQGVDGIDADCGGELACATCHVYVAPNWLPLLPPPSGDEREMLAYALNVDERSRLSCQIRMSAAMEGIVVTIPSSQK